ncbi:CobW family GTP-binding protein [Streptomyces sp. NPDC059161]|uniref:CobW family GTP-binding protein n=1 Tax=Streptomyces sp. NPDC059161 TaxID=3346749 RepID=UPI0036A27901
MSSPNPSQQIPVIVLAGFLGSGKTTLLNHLLRAGRGTRIGAIVNDFGSIEIDAMTVAGQLGDSTVSLGNGCLCCAVDASELDLYLDRLTRPAARLDVIVIEASGLAEPQELVKMLLASENPRIVYGGLVEVVDAAEYDTTREKHPEIERHLAIADLVVLNKTDRVDAADLARLRTALGGAAAVVEAAYGRVDPELFFDRRPVTERVGQLAFDDLLDDLPGDGDGACAGEGCGDGACAGDGRGCDRSGGEGGEGGEGGDGGSCRGGHGHGACGDGGHGQGGHSHRVGAGRGRGGHLHAGYESVAFTSDVPMDPRRLMAFLDTRPEGLYRIKGFVDFGADDPRNRYTVHAVGRFLRFYPEPWGRERERLTQLVLIGSGIDAPALYRRLAECVTSGPGATPDERAMWGVLRYVPEPSQEDQEDQEDQEPEEPLEPEELNEREELLEPEEPLGPEELNEREELLEPEEPLGPEELNEREELLEPDGPGEFYELPGTVR